MIDIAHIGGNAFGYFFRILGSTKQAFIQAVLLISIFEQRLSFRML